MTSSRYSNIRVPNRTAKPVHPIEIFQSSAVNDERINDLWLAQGDALREWHDHRDRGDIAIALNTGAGKTLVGLLIAQSLVNASRRQVVYACSSIQLVDQTAEKARGYGLPVTTYVGGTFSGDGLYQRAEAPCITTYQALFNGRTRFANDDLAAVVFDDAHTAEHILRDQFSLSINRHQLSSMYEAIWTLFQPYHERVGLGTSYSEMLDGNSQRQFFVPPSQVHHEVNELRRLLVNASLNQHQGTMFTWEHIRDHEDLCCLLISEDEITLTPLSVPVSTLPYFNDAVKRVYLSATLSAPDSFVRAFGRKPDRIIAPRTTAGECERMVIFPRSTQGTDQDIATAKEIIRDYKTLILAPSFYRARKWADVSQIPTREQVPQAVYVFRHSPQVQKLTLASRYDGIDFPGDACRVMVVDDLPTGSGPLERFQWERLNMQNSFRSLLASRIVQSFGRISRGMSDHGVVVVTGDALVKWLQLPRNRELLPRFLQRQIEIGESISHQANNIDDLLRNAADCLGREPAWVEFYTEQVKDLPVQTTDDNQEMAVKIAQAESRFGKFLWDRDFESATAALNPIIADAVEFSQHTGAWLSLWLGFAFEMVKDLASASFYYNQARALETNIPRSALPSESEPTGIPLQVVKTAEQMRIGYWNSVSIQIPKTLEADLRALAGTGSSRQTEEALRCLGQYLGLNSSRPDNDPGTGPDVLWIDEHGTALCMEVKTDKELSSVYRKEDAGQLHDHIQWVRHNHQVSDVIPVFVGPLFPPSSDVNPSEDMGVIELRRFSEVGQRLTAALRDVAGAAMPLSLQRDLLSVMSERGLLYSDILKSLDIKALADLRTT